MSQNPETKFPLLYEWYSVKRDSNFIYNFFLFLHLFFYFYYQCIGVLFKVFGLNSKEEKRKKVCLGFSCVL